MAESSFARLNSQSTVARAGVNTGPPPFNDPSRTERADAVIHHPFYQPGTFDRGYEPPAAPLLSEDEKRARLRAALAAQTAADTALASAERTYARAREHLQRCQDAVQAFASIDEDAAAETVRQLCDGDLARVELPPAMQARLTARDLAHAECIAAEAANKHLTRTLAVAREAVTRAASDVRTATIRLLGLEASRLAIEFREVEAEQDDRFLRLAQFDRYAAGVSPLPDHVMGALTAEPRDRRGKIRGQLDVSGWRERAERLQAEVQAEPVEESV